MSTTLIIILFALLIVMILIIVIAHIFSQPNAKELPPMHEDVIINEDTKKAEGDSRMILPF